ncbi:MAG TPA: Clp protease N-terminal domain-containing protein [Gemmatimonadaceae bacterium]
MAMRGFNFTQRVRGSLTAARNEAARLGCEYLWPEHILLGILVQGDNVGAEVLANLEVTREAVARDVEAKMRQRPRKDVAPDAEVPYSSRAKRVLEMAMGEAGRLGHSYVGTEHLLLGILQDPTSDASVILAAHGVTPDRAQTEIERLIAARTAASGSTVHAAGAQHAVASADGKHVRLAMFMSVLALILSIVALLLAVTRRQ